MVSLLFSEFPKRLTPNGDKGALSSKLRARTGPPSHSNGYFLSSFAKPNLEKLPRLRYRSEFL